MLNIYIVQISCEYDQMHVKRPNIFSKFRRRAPLHDHVFILILHAGVFTDGFCCHLHVNAHGFTNPSVSHIQK